MTPEVNQELIYSEIKNLQRSVDKIETRLEKEYVTQDQLKLYIDKQNMQGRVVYGAVGMVLLAFLGAVIALVLK